MPIFVYLLRLTLRLDDKPKVQRIDDSPLANHPSAKNDSVRNYHTFFYEHLQFTHMVTRVMWPNYPGDDRSILDQLWISLILKSLTLTEEA